MANTRHNDGSVAIEHSLAGLDIGPEINWTPTHLVDSAWLEHIPFAFWMIKVLRPSVLVELGTHRGASYAAFCQAVSRSRIHTRCYAVDTWVGDKHAGYYDESAFAEVVQLNERLYSHFSSLLRTTFIDALPYFANGEVDLLHIDGLHTYEAVSEDFHSWLPKLSDQAIVLFHDTNVRRDEFGVWRLWRELSAQYPHFEFFHGYGLGVLGIGQVTAAPIQTLFDAAARQDQLLAIRDAFAARGAAARAGFELQQTQGRIVALAAENAALQREKTTREAHVALLESAKATVEAEAAQLRSEKGVVEAEAAQLRSEKGVVEAEVARLRSEKGAVEAEAAQLRTEKAAVKAEAFRMREDKATAEAEATRLRANLHVTEAWRTALLASTSWRITAPIRIIRRAGDLPSGATKSIMRCALGVLRMLHHSDTLRFTTQSVHQKGTGAHLLPAVRQDTPDPLPHSPASIRKAGHPPVEQLRLLRLRVLIIAELSLPQCKKYRVDQKRDMISTFGFDCTVVPWAEFETAAVLLQTHTVAIFYRVPAFPGPLALMDHAEHLGVPLYFEIDDLIFDLDKYLANPNLASIDPDTMRGLIDGAILYRRAIERCRNVIASTPRLAELMRAVGGGQSFTIENALDKETLCIAASACRRPDDGKVRIVYGSGTKTHDADFEFIAQALVRIAIRHPHVDIFLVGHLEPPRGLLNLGKRVVCVAPLPYADYMGLLAQGDIAVAPLFPTEFNEAKSNIKFLEAASVGIPAVCSPRSAFVGAIRHGVTGFLAESEEEWFTALDVLVANASLREHIGAAARQQVISDYAPESVALSQLLPLLDRHRPEPDPRLHIMEVNVLYRPQSFGGATIVVEDLARLLHARPDTRVSIFTTAPEGWLSPHGLERSDEEGMPVIRIGAQDRAGWFEEWWDEEAGGLFREALRSLRPDIVHFHAMQGLGAAPLEVCRKEKIPFVVTLHDAWWVCQRQFLVTAEGRYCGQRRIDLNVCASCVSSPGSATLRAWRLRRALNGADQLLAPSEHWRQFYLENGFAPEHITTNENGIRRPTAPQPNARPARLRFGFVAGTEVVKGFPLVKQTFEALQRNDWELVLVNHALRIGQDSFAGITWRVRGSIRTVPPYATEQADEFYESIDVLLFPSQWPESFGLTVREALARNKWVIATDQGGAAGAIVPGKNGTLIPLGQAEPLKAAVEALLDGTPDLHSWINPYTERIRSIETQADELRNIIARVVSRSTEVPTEVH